MSDSAKTDSASGRIRAPCSTYSPSGIADPSPAPCWTTTSCPRSASSRTPAGVSATRYSSVLISVGAPTFMGVGPFSGFLGSGDELAAAQRQPELDAVAGAAEVAARQLLDLADPVAERVAVAVQPPCRGLPLPVALDERLERAHQLAAVVPLAVLDRPEQRLAEQAQRVRVLEREQQLERAEVAVRRDTRLARRLRAAVAVRVDGDAGAQRARLERAARLVVGAAGVAGGHRAARAGGRGGADRRGHPLQDPLADVEQLVVLVARQQRAHEVPG